jgi:LmbE family N-acetylglucosaminyl deacetylase
LQRRLREEAPDAVFVQPYEGGHPDHDAVAFAVAAAGRLIATTGDLSPTIIEMTAYHADGPELATGTFLPADTSVTTIELETADRLRKRRMIDCFASQRELLAGFGTEVERFRAAPLYDFERLLQLGEVHYERLGWSITGELWQHHARQAVAELGLRSPAWA